MEAALARLRASFGVRFPTALDPLRFFASPGRINLLGEHTDYTEGLCLPAAINLRTLGAFQAIPAGAPDANRITLHSAGFPHPAVVDLGRPIELPSGGWERYVASAVQVLSGHLSNEGRQLKGMRGYLESDIPAGGGLSSSAALELLVLEAASVLSGAPLPRRTLVELGQRAEWRYGVRCGILDFCAIAYGRKGEVSLLDCRTQEARPIRVELGTYMLLIAFTRERSLAGSEYNRRRLECEEAAAALRTLTGRSDLKTLRDVSPALLREWGPRLDLPQHNPHGLKLRARAEHVVGENERVLQAVQVLARGDVHAFGRLLLETHASLRDNLEVSSAELDAMVESAVAFGESRGAPVYGRMMGGGFGGPALLLVPSALAAEAKAGIGRLYRQRTGRQGRFWDVQIEAGLEELVP